MACWQDPESLWLWQRVVAQSIIILRNLSQECSSRTKQATSCDGGCAEGFLDGSENGCDEGHGCDEGRSLTEGLVEGWLLGCEECPLILCGNVCGEGTILLHGDAPAAPPAAAVDDSPSSKGTHNATPPSQTKLTPTSLTTSIKKRLPNTPRHKISPRSTSQSSFNRSSTLSCACCVVHSLAWRNAVRTQYSCARVCWRDAPCRLAIGVRKLPPSLVEHTSFFVDCGSLRGFGRLMMAWFARGEGGGSWKPWGLVGWIGWMRVWWLWRWSPLGRTSGG